MKKQIRKRKPKPKGFTLGARLSLFIGGASIPTANGHDAAAMIKGRLHAASHHK